MSGLYSACRMMGIYPETGDGIAWAGSTVQAFEGGATGAQFCGGAGLLFHDDACESAAVHAGAGAGSVLQLAPAKGRGNQLTKSLVSSAALPVSTWTPGAGAKAMVKLADMPTSAKLSGAITSGRPAS